MAQLFEDAHEFSIKLEWIGTNLKRIADIRRRIREENKNHFDKVNMLTEELVDCCERFKTELNGSPGTKDTIRALLEEVLAT